MPRPLPRAVSSLVDAQAGVVARRQLLAHGVEWERVAGHVRARRWVEATPRVISTTTGTPTREQREWTAVLHAGPRSMLANLSAATRQGLQGWERDDICVLVDGELSFEAVAGVDFFRSRRSFDLLRSPRPGIAVCRVEPAVLLWAGYEAPVRAAHGVIAASVQQRLTTAARLVEWIEVLRPLRRGRSLARTASFVDGGAHSGAELELGRMCRRFGLPPPDRQVARLDSAGKRRWTDAEWRLADGTTLVLEVDGSFHADARQAGDDARRSRRITSRERLVVRCTAFELTHEPAEVAADLIALGVPGRVPHTASWAGLRHTT